MNKPCLSFWERDTFFSDISFTIIGSGIVGISSALKIKETHPNEKVVVLEAGMIPSGASTRNAGFACFGSVTEVLDDLSHMPEDEVLALVEKRWKGLQKLQKRVGKELEWTTCGGYELFMENEEDIYKDCCDAIPIFNKKLSSIIGRNDIYVNKDIEISKFGFKGVKHLIKNQAEGSIHTGKMMSRLLEIAKNKGIEIYNGAKVVQLENSSIGVEILLQDGRVLKTNKVLVATNGFAKLLLNNIDVVPARNQVMITKSLYNLKVKGTFHYNEGYYYFRNVGDRILFGGGRNLNPLNEQTNEFGTSSEIQNHLLEMMKEVILPNTPFEVDMWWSGILGVGKTKKPIIKKINENIAISVRMGGMGVAIGTLVGEEGADLLI